MKVLEVVVADNLNALRRKLRVEVGIVRTGEHGSDRKALVKVKAEAVTLIATRLSMLRRMCGEDVGDGTALLPSPLTSLRFDVKGAWHWMTSKM